MIFHNVLMLIELKGMVDDYYFGLQCDRNSVHLLYNVVTR